MPRPCVANPMRDRTTLLLLPAFAMLALVFLVPLGSFFIRTLLIDSDPSLLWPEIVSVVTSRVMLQAIVTTNWISLLVTFAVLLMGYPIAYYLANRQGLRATLVIFCIVVPYFTSIIVRTYSWMVVAGIVSVQLRVIVLLFGGRPQEEVRLQVGHTIAEV